MANKDGFSLAENFIHLQEGTNAVPVPVGPEFWTTIGERHDLMEGRLVGLVHIDNANEITTKEMHPEGDEILLVQKGRMDVILFHGAEEEVVPLKAGDWALIPKGRWHTARVHEPTDLIFITPGKGTVSENL